MCAESIHAPMYWRGQKARYRLIGSNCSDCGIKHMPARPVCPDCGNQQSGYRSVLKEPFVIYEDPGKEPLTSSPSAI